MLSESLRGVIAQLLLRKADGKGRVAAVEVMISNQAIKNLIREEKTYQILSVMQTGKSQGMQTMENHMKYLVEKELVKEDEVAAYLKETE
jgi:twitching motility protein PilT